MADTRYTRLADVNEWQRILQETLDLPRGVDSRGNDPMMVVVLTMPEYRRLTRYRQHRTSRQRIGRFLRFAAAFRRQAGVDLDLPWRRSRPSPFSSRGGS